MADPHHQLNMHPAHNYTQASAHHQPAGFGQPGPIYSQAAPGQPHSQGLSYGHPAPNHPHYPQGSNYSQPSLGSYSHGPTYAQACPPSLPPPSNPHQTDPPSVYGYHDADGIWTHSSNWDTEFVPTIAPHGPWRGIGVYRETPATTQLPYVAVASHPGYGLERIPGYANLWRTVFHPLTTAQPTIHTNAGPAGPMATAPGMPLANASTMPTYQPPPTMHMPPGSSHTAPVQQAVGRGNDYGSSRSLLDIEEEENDGDVEIRKEDVGNVTEDEASDMTIESGGTSEEEDEEGGSEVTAESAEEDSDRDWEARSSKASKKSKSASDGYRDSSSVRGRDATPHPSASSHKSKAATADSEAQAGPSKSKKKSSATATNKHGKKETSKPDRLYYRAKKPKR